ncbi:hypothetical protein MSP7336_04522 [Mycobacterium shimoidei]|uniref:Proline rich protein n=1 Tax=Mycobacterium shimoidei TaxID=29313 RepID=A0A375Z5F5_MYCSH|nr:hypothetical protein MSP7336_04522 [Mycobacterium shimoidei]
MKSTLARLKDTVKLWLTDAVRLRPTKEGNGERGWPGYLFGGRVRTSTVVLIAAFCAVWWTYDTYKPEPPPPAPQVVPPGFVPDPNYTWVPRTRVQQPPSTVTVTKTVPPPPTTTPPPPTTTTTTPPPFQLPVLPPPFGPATSASTPPPPTPPPAPPPLLPPLPGLPGPPQ